MDPIPNQAASQQANHLWPGPFTTISRCIRSLVTVVLPADWLLGLLIQSVQVGVVPPGTSDVVGDDGGETSSPPAPVASEDTWTHRLHLHQLKEKQTPKIQAPPAPTEGRINTYTKPG